MKAKIEAMQTDLAGINADLHKFQALETKVEKLDSTVSKAPKSLSTLKTGQWSSSDKLGKFCRLIIKLFPNTNSEEMDTSQPAERPRTLTATANLRSEPPDETSKKLWTRSGFQSTTRKWLTLINTMQEVSPNLI